MAQVSGELTNEVKVSNLSRGMPIQPRGECVNQRFVVCEYVEISPFQEVPEMFNQACSQPCRKGGSFF